MIFTPPSKHTLFKQRRKKLCEQIAKNFPLQCGVVVIPAGFEQEKYPFRQESSFYYLTGISEPAVVLCLFIEPDGSKDVLYVPRFGIDRGCWMDVTIQGPEDASRFEVDEIRHLGNAVSGFSLSPVFSQEHYQEFLQDLTSYLGQNERIFTVHDAKHKDQVIHHHFMKHMQQWVPNLQEKRVDISSLLSTSRRLKDEYEIDLLYKAVQITQMAHHTAASLMKEDMPEYEIAAAVEYVFSKVAGAKPAFPSIVAAGKNATKLHYNSALGTLKKGDLVIVDIGAEYGYYAADITRTYPVGGTFSAPQKELYEIVLTAQRYIEALAKPGMFLKNDNDPEQSLHHQALAYFKEYDMAEHFYHNIGHFLGLDVHDVGDISQPLAVGDVFTLEPGLYLPEQGIGIRIEDDYVMTDEGAVCLSYELGKEVDEIEAMVQEPSDE